MPTISVNFFGTPQESLDLIYRVAVQHNGEIVTEGAREGPGSVLRLELDEVMQHGREFWIIENGSSEKLSADCRYGILQVLLPWIEGASLLMGAVSIKYEEERPEYSLKVLRAIRRTIKREFKSGLWAQNYRFGGERYYKDLFFSDSAERIWKGGSILRPQFGNGFVTYSIGAPD